MFDQSLEETAKLVDVMGYLLNNSFVVEIILILFGVLVYTLNTKTKIWHNILRDSISNHIQRIASKNDEVNVAALDLMNQCESILSSGNYPVNDQEIDQCIKSVRYIYEKSHGASEPVQTGAFLLNNTYRTLNSMKRSNQKHSQQALFSHTIYGFLFLGLNFVQRYANISIEIPSKVTVEKESVVKAPVRKHIKERHVQTIPGVSKKIDLHPLSTFVVVFYDSVLRQFTPPEVGGAHRRFFETIEDNTMMLLFLKAQAVYFPTHLQGTRIPLFNRDKELGLVHFRSQMRHDEHGSREVFELYYSNLDTIFAYVHNYKTHNDIIGLIPNEKYTFHTNFKESVVECKNVGCETVKIVFTAQSGKIAYFNALPFMEWKIGRKLERRRVFLAIRFVAFWLIGWIGKHWQTLKGDRPE